MRIRFGEFPDDHHFILIARPFVEWSFKYFEWLIVAATVHIAQDKTHSRILLVLEWFIYLLILGFNGALADWILSLRLDSHGKAPASKTRFRRVAATVGGVALTLISVAIVNLVSQNLIDAFMEFQKAQR